MKDVDIVLLFFLILFYENVEVTTWVAFSRAGLVVFYFFSCLFEFQIRSLGAQVSIV